MTSETGDDRLLKEVVAGPFLPTPPDRVGVAVSGGGDSMALLGLLAAFARETPGLTLHVATVDHGLRPESRDEAQMVGDFAHRLGLSHDILPWSGWDRTGNLQDAARRARRTLLSDWAAGRDIPVVALGHTADDQAETILMRLARAAGVDGLSGMAVRSTYRDLVFVRPVLSLRRTCLRGYLERHGIAWADDPSNEDDGFGRVRARRALAALEPLGLSVPMLCTVGQNLSAVRELLDFYGFAEARSAVRIEAGDVVLPLVAARRLHPEMLRRLLQRALAWITGRDYPPRGRALSLLVEAVRSGEGMTLHGCIATVGGATLRITREANAVVDVVAAPGDIWDGRWRLTGPAVPGAEVRALGEAGIATCPDWRDTGLPRTSLLAAPAVWRGDEVLAAPLAGRPNGWRAELCRDGEAFFAAFLTH